MSAKFGFSIDQLMELAGLSVAIAVGKEFPIDRILDEQSTRKPSDRVLVVAGPGNNG